MEDVITRAEHNEFLRRMEDEHRRINRRIENLEEANIQNQELVANVGKMAANMEHMVEEQQKQGKRLEALEEVPNKSWNTVKNGLLNAIGAAIGGAILAVILYFM